MLAVPVVLACAALLSAGAQDAPASREPATPANLQRVRASLERPGSKLTLPNLKPDFTVHIEVRRPLHEIFESPPWLLPHAGWRPPALPATTAFGTIPMVNLDLLAIGRRAADAWRGHTARGASQEVQRAIAEYCAAQPNAAAIQICSSSPAIR